MTYMEGRRNMDRDQRKDLENEQMPQEDDLDDLADFFKVFGDTTRIKILYVLLCS